MSTKDKKSVEQEVSVEEKLLALYTLQTIDSKADEIRRLRGELPLEVQDLEDEIAGLETRIANINTEIKFLDDEISGKQNEIKDSEALIKKYETQQMKVRNNREFDSISKEVEFQNLEIQLNEKKIKEFQYQLTLKKGVLTEANAVLDERKKDLEHSKGELDSIISETRKDEDVLLEKRTQIEIEIEPRLLTAYKRIREGARNGLAVVSVQRDACGGCFNKIPPQRQLDIASRKKVIVCEFCGRILVDNEMASSVIEK